MELQPESLIAKIIRTIMTLEYLRKVSGTQQVRRSNYNIYGINIGDPTVVMIVR